MAGSSKGCDREWAMLKIQLCSGHEIMHICSVSCLMHPVISAGPSSLTRSELLIPPPQIIILAVETSSSAYKAGMSHAPCVPYC